MRLNPNPELLKIGDAVMTDYDGQGVSLRGRQMTIFAFTDCQNCASGRLVTAGDGRTRSVAVSGIDASWFVPVKTRKVLL